MKQLNRCKFLLLFLWFAAALACKTARTGSGLESLENQANLHKAVSVNAHSFLLNGQPKLLRGGSLQWFRLPPEEWEDRIKLFKAAGYNTIDMYAAWRNHEAKEGVFDFKTFDIKRFLDLAKKYELYVYFRPGPYITNEMDAGGLPAWVIQKSSKAKLSATERDGVLNLRTQDADYLDAVDRYFKALITEIKPYLYSNGGPIILFGIENEYNWFEAAFAIDQASTYKSLPERGSDQKLDILKYFEFLRDISLKYGIDVPITTCPGKAGTDSMASASGIISMPNFYGDNALFPEYFAYKQLRDMHDPKKDLGHYVNFPSGTTETERAVSTLRRQIMGGFDAVMQFNIFGFHQEGRLNSVTLSGSKPKANINFIRSITDFDRLNAHNVFFEPSVGYFHNVVDYYGAVSSGGVIREKFYGMRRSNLFFDSFEGLLAAAGSGRRSSAQNIEGQDQGIRVDSSELGSLDPDAKKAHVNYWLSLDQGAALLGLLNPGAKTVRLKAASITAFGEKLPLYSELVIAPEDAPGSKTGTASSESAYDFLLPIRFPLGQGQTLAYASSEILSFRNKGRQRLLIVYGVSGSEGEMRLQGSGLKLLSGAEVFRKQVATDDSLTLVYKHQAAPQKASLIDAAGHSLDLLILDREAAGRSWFVPNKDGHESLFIGPALLEANGKNIALEVDKDHAKIYVSDDVRVSSTNLREIGLVPGFRLLSVEGAKDLTFEMPLGEGLWTEDKAESLVEFNDQSFQRLGAEASALDFNGITEGHAWYRAHVTLSAKDLAQKAELKLESVSDFAGLYLNGSYLLTLAPLGTEVNSQGKTKYYPFTVPAGYLKEGDNVLSIRNEIWGHGSFMFPRGEFNRLMIAGRSVKLPWVRPSLPALGYDAVKGVIGKGSLNGQAFVDWKVRGGLGGDLQGFPAKPSDPLTWKPAAFPIQLEPGSVRWYEFSIQKSDLPLQSNWRTALALTLKGRSTKATIYLNGRLIGRWLSDVDWLHRGSWARPLRDMWMNTDPDSFPLSSEILKDGSNRILLLVEDASDQTGGDPAGRIESATVELAREERALMDGKSFFVAKPLRKITLDLGQDF